MLSNLWARITGADKGKRTPNQQAVVLGAPADFSIVNPYGLYCDTPSGTLSVQLKDDALLCVTQTRPRDLARGEPAFFHPATNTRIVARANGDLDVLVGNGGGNVNVISPAAVNVQCATATLEASGSVEVNASTATVTAETTVNGVTTINGDTTINGSLGVAGDTTIAGGLEVEGDFDLDGTATLGTGGSPIARLNAMGDHVASAQHTAT